VMVVTVLTVFAVPGEVVVLVVAKLAESNSVHCEPRQSRPPPPPGLDSAVIQYFPGLNHHSGVVG